MRYCGNIYDWKTWLKICEKYRAGNYVNFSVGDRVQAGNLSGVIDEVRPCNKWEHFPCSQFVGIQGSDNLFLNTYLKKT